MHKYKLKLLYKEYTSDTVIFKWTRPVELTFSAGQNFDWTLINPPESDPHGNTRTFSACSAPYENHLMFATRMRDSAFKRNLENIKLGGEIIAEGPYGSFILEENPLKSAVFLTGGIGVTPVISIVKQATQDKLPHKIFLLYANKTRETAVFMDVLDELSRLNPNFTFIPTFTRDAGWSGENGRISIELIQKYVKNTTDSVFYISGPMPMVNTLRLNLLDNGIDKANIRTEDFPGY